MKKTIKKTFKFTEGFTEKLNKEKNPDFLFDELRTEKFAHFFKASFNCWPANDPDLKMETSITKKSLPELENAIIRFLS